jgi:imidazolonepropionase-like amidohydrolase
VPRRPVDLREDPKLNRFYPRDVLLALTGRRRVWAHHSELSIVPMAAQAAKLQRAGGLVGVGSHGEVQGLGYHWEMEMLAMGGMTPAEILTAATRDGARVIGLEADLGSIEAGKLADLVVLDADPLTDIRHTQRLALVMKDGVLYDGETLALV